MSRNLIVYKVEYRNPSDPWSEGKFIKIKRIVMTPDEVNQTDGYWRNHSHVKTKFKKQMGDNYQVWRITKA
tara:strand:+ start:621 stop:833 length:213 start_codon:yes stop_codon:yes gene_type:complete